MWKKLDALYVNRDPDRIILIEEQIFGAKMVASSSAESHIDTKHKLL